jgi:hypothetical protein
LKGSGFRASEEVTAAVTGGVAAKLADELMVALGSRFESRSGEDVSAILELFKATPSVMTTAEAVMVHKAPASVAEQQNPPLLNEAGGDEAVGSPAASVKPVHAEKDIISSPKDDSSLDETPLGEDPITPGKLPVNSMIPHWRTLS